MLQEEENMIIPTDVFYTLFGDLVPKGAYNENPDLTFGSEAGFNISEMEVYHVSDTSRTIYTYFRRHQRVRFYRIPKGNISHNAYAVSIIYIVNNDCSYYDVMVYSLTADKKPLYANYRTTVWSVWGFILKSIKTLDI